MGLPSVSDVFASSILRFVLLILGASGLAALLFDYARMLRLHRRMVRLATRGQSRRC